MVQMLAEVKTMRENMAASEVASQAAATVASGQIKELADARMHDIGRMAELREQVAAKRSGGPVATLIDTKGIGKPKQFASKVADWADFAFKYLNFAGSAFPEVKKLTSWAQMEVAPIEDYAEADLVASNAEHVSMQIYLSISQLIEGEALDIVRNVGDDNGLEAWRRLCKRFDPQTVSRRRSAMTSILNPGKATMAVLGSHIEKWEEKVRGYEKRTTKSIDDDIKARVLTEMCPDKLMEHAHLNQMRLTTYLQVRDEISMYLEQKHSKDADSADKKNDPDAMDVSYLGKGKGKGKD